MKPSEPPPGFFLFPQDYFGDAMVRLMPADLRLVWVEAFFLMSQSPRRGVLLKKTGKPYTPAELATIINCQGDLVETAFQYVVKEKIASVDRNTGALVSRRMVRDEIKRVACEKAGRKGWQAKLAKRANPNQLPLPLQPALSVVPVPDPVPIPQPEQKEKEEKSVAPAVADDDVGKRGAKRLVPTAFPVRDSDRAWAIEQHLAVDLDYETGKMIDHYRGVGEMRPDWNATRRNWWR